MRKEERKSQPSTCWQEFCDMRVGYLSSLATIVEQGVARKDTEHPAFWGCIDWHSSVHGTYALLVAFRLTGNTQWLESAESVLHSERLAAELICLQRGELDHELPYGYAWFLKLAKEREQWSGKTDLEPLATEIAQHLEEWIFSLSHDEVIHHVCRREYGNLSWAVLNLWEWGCWKEHAALRKRLTSFTRERLVSFDQHFSESYDDPIDEFFAASLQRSMAIISILPSEETCAWLRSFPTDILGLQPLAMALKPHSAGLNFSRAWGLWSLFLATGNVSYRDHYVNHIVTHMELPQYWRDDYKKYSHWVPQFGIYAIALSMEDV